MTVTLVAAVGRNGVIGVDGGLPWHLSGDLRRFKALTVGHVLVMGRLTYESIGRPLPKRLTVVVTRQPNWAPSGGPVAEVTTAPDVPTALAQAGDIDDDVFVVGGGQIYREAMGYADRLALSWVDQTPRSDTFFPAVDGEQWREIAREDFEGWSAVDYVRIGAPRATTSRAAIPGQRPDAL